MTSVRIAYCQRTLATGRAERAGVPLELCDLNHEVFDGDDALSDFQAVDLIWLQGNANWYPNICRGLTAQAARPMTLVWHTEPLPPPPQSGLPRPRLSIREVAKILLREPRATDPYTNARRLRRLHKAGLPDVLVVSSRGRQAYLASQGIPSHFVPLGYHPAKHGEDRGLERDIDVLFLGQMLRRRKKLIRRLVASGVAVRGEGSWFKGPTWGEGRTVTLNRTKILLNLSRFAGEFAGLRLILGMANGAMVVSEPIRLPEPFIPGTHYIEAPVEQMPVVLRHYLDHPDQRRQIAAQGRQFVTHELTLQRSVQRILQIVDTNRRESFDEAHSPIQAGDPPGGD